MQPRNRGNQVSTFSEKSRLEDDLNRISVWCAEMQLRIESLEKGHQDLDERTTGQIFLGNRP